MSNSQIYNAELLEQLVRHSPSGIVVLSKDGIVELANSALTRIFVDVEAPEGESIKKVLPYPSLHGGIDEQCSAENRVSIDGKDLLVRVRALDEGRQLWLIDDVSVVTKQEAYRREFVANVSHELRTPATAIAGYAQLLMDEMEAYDEDTQYMISAIHRNALRLNLLFKDLLTLSKIELGDGLLDLEPIRLKTLVNEAVDKQQSRAESLGIVFQIMVSEGLEVMAHRDALNHIIGNLVENAVKYNRINGLVTIRASYKEERERVLLEVIDLGRGIAAADQERIFERFYRVDKGRTREVGGTGLGLSIVSRFVELIDATIELRSQENKGSIFRVFIHPVSSPSA